MTTLADTLTEGRILIALIVEPEILRGARELEVEDFTDLRHRAVFSAIRNLEARSILVDAFEIDAELRRRDEQCGSLLTELAGLAFIGALMLETTAYGNPILWEFDVWWLRELAQRRRDAVRLAEVA